MDIENLRKFLLADESNYKSQTEQAKAIGINQQTFNEFMRENTKFPRGDNLIKMLDYYNQKNGK